MEMTCYISNNMKIYLLNYELTEFTLEYNESNFFFFFFKYNLIKYLA